MGHQTTKRFKKESKICLAQYTAPIQCSGPLWANEIISDGLRGSQTRLIEACGPIWARERRDFSFRLIDIQRVHLGSPKWALAWRRPEVCAGVSLSLSQCKINGLKFSGRDEGVDTGSGTSPGIWQVCLHIPCRWHYWRRLFSLLSSFEENRS